MADFLKWWGGVRGICPQKIQVQQEQFVQGVFQKSENNHLLGDASDVEMNEDIQTCGFLPIMTFVIPLIMSSTWKASKPTSCIILVTRLGANPRPSALTATCCKDHNAPNSGPSNVSSTMKLCTMSMPPGRKRSYARP
mmetsp:Transcript_10356/g.19079  ORF Transcript_10356/g.19079 Transcript_10356/m.19079 type:complete len:138 (-) Transcript_10356:966-1379(-)